MSPFDRAVVAMVGAHEDAVRRLQRELASMKLELEGCGAPRGEASSAPPIPAPPSARALAVAATEWQRGVREPPGDGWEAIGKYITGVGWTTEVVGGQAGDKYNRNGQFAWCGVFVGWCLLQAGWNPKVLAGVAGKYRGLEAMVSSSCYRLVRDYAGTTARRIAPSKIDGGDIVIVGPDPDRNGATSWGAHVTMAAGPPSYVTEGSVGTAVVPTFEGNARGIGPDGDTYEGVVRGSRPLASSSPREYRVLHAIRPLPEDFRS